MFDITCELFKQIFFKICVHVGTVDLWNFILLLVALILNEDHKVNGKQILLDSDSHIFLTVKMKFDTMIKHFKLNIQMYFGVIYSYSRNISAFFT